MSAVASPELIELSSAAPVDSGQSSTLENHTQPKFLASVKTYRLPEAILLYEPRPPSNALTAVEVDLDGLTRPRRWAWSAAQERAVLPPPDLGVAPVPRLGFDLREPFQEDAR